MSKHSLSRSGWAKRSRGFSLIELMVVIVLISVMVAVIIPEMRGTFSDEVLRSTSRDLTRALKLAYSQSITVNQRHRVRLDLTNGRYVVERPSRAGEAVQGFVPLADFPGGQGAIDKRITVSIQRSAPNDPSGSSPPGEATESLQNSEVTATDSILFYPDGTAEAKEVVVRDQEGFGLALRINPVTARVRVGPVEKR